MSIYEKVITKIRQMPEPLVYEVQDFVDFLLARLPSDPRQLSVEDTDLAAADMTDYRTNLEAYEERLARGEIQWT